MLPKLFWLLCRIPPPAQRPTFQRVPPWPLPKCYTHPSNRGRAVSDDQDPADRWYGQFHGGRREFDFRKRGYHHKLLSPLSAKTPPPLYFHEPDEQHHRYFCTPYSQCQFASRPIRHSANSELVP